MSLDRDDLPSLEDIPLSGAQYRVLALVLAVVMVGVLSPMFLTPSSDPIAEDAKSGSVTTPTASSPSASAAIASQPTAPPENVSSVPNSHVADSGSPPTDIAASQGAQTMRVSTTTVDGERALSLSDSVNHDGRWVSVGTEWLRQEFGTVPRVATVANSERGGSYTEPITVRDGQAMWWVRGFSTNNVTFGGELVIRDRPAVDGTSHSYSISDLASTSNVTVNVKGIENTEEDSLSGLYSDGDTITANIAGNSQASGNITFAGTGTSHDIVSAEGDGSTDKTRELVGDSSFNDEYSQAVEVTPKTNMSVSELLVGIGATTGTDPGISVRVYIDSGRVDSDWHEGTQVATWDPSWTTGTQTIPLTPNYQMRAGQHYEIEFITPNGQSDGDGTADTISLRKDESASTTKSATTKSAESSGAFTRQTFGDVELSGPATSDPAVDTDGDGISEASVSGILASGESVTRTVSLGPSDDTWNVSTTGGAVAVSSTIRETTATQDAGITLNNQTKFVSGTLAGGETRQLTFNQSHLQEGTNEVTVRMADDGLSNDAPAMSANVTYRHELTERKSVEFQSEALSERYNFSWTTTAVRNDAVIGINHAETVVRMRTLETRINETGGWSAVPSSAYSLSGSDLDVDADQITPTDRVPKGTTIEVRSAASKVDPVNARISVVRVTPSGSNMDSRIRLEEWHNDSALEVSQTAQGTMLHYTENESFSAESDYARIGVGGEQHLMLPDASSGAEVGIRTLPVTATVETNQVELSVPEDRANASNPLVYVRPGATTGDEWTLTYLAASDGQWYAAEKVDTSEEFDKVQGSEPLTIPTDDNITSLIAITPTNPPAESGGGIVATVNRGNIVILSLLFSLIALLFITGRRPGAAERTIDRGARSVGRLAGRIPRVGNSVEGYVERVLRAGGDVFVTVGKNELLSLAISAAIVVGSFQADLISIGPETLATLVVAGIAVGSLLLLIRLDAFTTARWIAIVGVTGVVAVQGLGEGDLLQSVINSDAFIFVVLIAAYAVVQLVREYRANNSPNDGRPQVIIDAGDGGSD